jgi:hypothetical protein
VSSTFTVSLTPPPAIAPVTLNPLHGLVSGGTPTFSGTGQPGFQVSVSDGDTALCSAEVAAGGTWSCVSSVKLTGGDHVLTAVQTGPAGQTSVPAAQDVSVPAAPVGVNATTTSSAGGLPVVSGTGEPGYGVTVTDGGGAAVCSTVVDADGDWSCVSVMAFTDGAHTLSVTQTDPVTGVASTPVDQVVAAPDAQTGTGGSGGSSGSGTGGSSGGGGSGGSSSGGTGGGTGSTGTGSTGTGSTSGTGSGGAGSGGSSLAGSSTLSGGGTLAGGSAPTGGSVVGGPAGVLVGLVHLLGGSATGITGAGLVLVAGLVLLGATVRRRQARVQAASEAA